MTKSFFLIMILMVFVIKSKGVYYCTDSDRAVENCSHHEEKVVCGWLKDEMVVCLKPPCFLEYASLCLACKDPNVDFVFEKKCPKSS